MDTQSFNLLVSTGYLARFLKPKLLITQMWSADFMYVTYDD